MTTRRQSGFTLIELVVTLAIASILLGIGVPSFVDVVRNARIGTQYNQMARALFIARSEAVKSSEFVVVCARSAPASLDCGGKDDWKNGWLVYVDVDSAIDSNASIDTGDTIIATEPALVGDNWLEVRARTANGATPSEVGHVRYLPRGDTDWESGSLVICDKHRGSPKSRVVNVKLTGDIQPGRPNGTETVPRDVFGSPIDCGTGT